MKKLDIKLPLDKFYKKYFGKKEWCIVPNGELSEEEIREIYTTKKEEFKGYKECYYAILSSLVEYKNVPVDILEEISKIRDKDVLISIALHPKTPKKILKKLMSSQYNIVRAHVCFNKNLSIEEINFMHRKEKVAYVKEAIERAIEERIKGFINR